MTEKNTSLKIGYNDIRLTERLLAKLHGAFSSLGNIKWIIVRKKNLNTLTIALGTEVHTFLFGIFLEGE